jgi:hypothetical protein
MGRGLHPRLFSAYTGANKQLRVSSCWIAGEGSANTTSYIVRQTGESTFVVKNTATGNTGAVRLQAANVTAAGQAVINVDPVGAGTGATVTARMRAKSAVVVNGGTSGYAVADTITLAGGTSTTAAILTVASVDGSGKILTATVSTAGSYSVLPANPVAQGSRTGTGVGTPTFTVTWEVLSYTVGAGGSAYVNAVADISGDGGATATVTVTTGAVSAVAPGDRGTFTTIPTVTIIGSAATEHAKRFSGHRVVTFEGNAYPWHEDGSSGAGEAELPLL